MVLPRHVTINYDMKFSLLLCLNSPNCILLEDRFGIQEKPDQNIRPDRRTCLQWCHNLDFE